MIDGLEKSFHNRFLLSEGNVIGVGRDAGPWINAILANRPGLRGTALEAAALEAFIAANRIRRINCLRIGDAAAMANALRATHPLLAKRAIDIVEFMYGPDFAAAGVTLRQVFEMLSSQGYVIFTLGGGKMAHKAAFDTADENSQPMLWAATAPRMLRKMANDKSILDTAGLMARFGVKPRGMIHIGAHLAEELPLYREIGFERILLIEANPELAKTIQEAVGNQPGVTIANVAVSDDDATVSLRVTSMDQSSSILPLKRHRNYYPSIHETKQVTVPSRRLGTLLSNLQLNPRDFNCISVDIQGAELQALRGAGSVLDGIDFIETEVNYEELYEGCGLIDDLEELLAGHGFECVDVACPFHPSWGDAAFIRKHQALSDIVRTTGTTAQKLRVFP